MSERAKTERVKTPRVVVTFASTADAMAMEAAAQDFGLPGRIIPVPSEISAGCGLSWRVEPSEKEALLAGMQQHGITYEGIYTVDMY